MKQIIYFLFKLITLNVAEIVSAGLSTVTFEQCFSLTTTLSSYPVQMSSI